MKPRAHRALRTVALCAALLGIAWAAGVVTARESRSRASAGEGTAAARAVGDSQHERGRKVYNFRCYFCHGYSGDAKTLAATYLTPPPRDFTAETARGLDRAAVGAALRQGRSATAMASFAGVLGEREIEDVAAFVELEFVRQRAANTAYHTRENGWPEHERYRIAYPFARGEIALDAPAESLSAAQIQGRQLFLSSCVTCHDRARVLAEGPAWAARPVSYPRGGFEPADVGAAAPTVVDAVSSASVYAKHDVPPALPGLNARERRGEKLYQVNCAFCHGADGTGKNWIGQFMEPKARDLTAYTPAAMPQPRLRQVIREGLPGTSMPAWQHVLEPREIADITAYVSRAFIHKDGVAAATAAPVR